MACTFYSASYDKRGAPLHQNERLHRSPWEVPDGWRWLPPRPPSQRWPQPPRRPMLPGTSWRPRAPLGGWWEWDGMMISFFLGGAWRLIGGMIYVYKQFVILLVFWMAILDGVLVGCLGLPFLDVLGLVSDLTEKGQISFEYGHLIQASSLMVKRLWRHRPRHPRCIIGGWVGCRLQQWKQTFRYPSPLARKMANILHKIKDQAVFGEGRLCMDSLLRWWSQGENPLENPFALAYKRVIFPTSTGEWFYVNDLKNAENLKWSPHTTTPINPQSNPNKSPQWTHFNELPQRTTPQPKPPKLIHQTKNKPSKNHQETTTYPKQSQTTPNHYPRTPKASKPQSANPTDPQSGPFHLAPPGPKLCRLEPPTAAARVRVGVRGGRRTGGLLWGGQDGRGWRWGGGRGNWTLFFLCVFCLFVWWVGWLVGWLFAGLVVSLGDRRFHFLLACFVVSLVKQQCHFALKKKSWLWFPQDRTDRNLVHRPVESEQMPWLFLKEKLPAFEWKPKFGKKESQAAALWQMVGGCFSGKKFRWSLDRVKARVSDIWYYI